MNHCCLWIARRKDKKNMSKHLFDFCVGNPPYQEETENNGRQSPVYDKFMEAAYEVSSCVELITPARFLFNAGQTSKAWNEKMLKDKHFKVLQYEADASKIFSNTDIKGGVAVTIRDTNKDYGEIGEFITSEVMRNIVHKMKPMFTSAMDEIHHNRSSYRLTDILYDENPELCDRVKKSERLSIGSNIFDKIPEVFFNTKPNDGAAYGRIFGRKNNERTYQWILEKYLQAHDNYDKWKVFVAKSNGTGEFGETLSGFEVAAPMTVATQTFISFGDFKEEGEANALSRYLSTKFVRALLGVCKITPDNARKEVWKYVPLQDFTSKSDIDWSKSIHEIDLQLYRKYGLSTEEITFIETNVKEME